MTTHSITLADARGNWVALEARVADEHDERAAGYQYVCPEEVESGAVLFVFRKPLTASFHMRNVFAPLDIAFFDSSGVMVDMTQMRPEPPGFRGEPRYYGSRLPYLYALEARRGFFASHGLSPGRGQLLIESLP